MIVIHCKRNHQRARAYIYNVIFHDFWRLKYSVQYEERNNIRLEIDGKSVCMADTFFQQEEVEWLNPKTLPRRPLQRIVLSNKFVACVTDVEVPIIYGDSGIQSLFDAEEKYCSLDVFGSAFFMLTRYEEIVKQERDKYDRFPAGASLACQENFIERPIINEYLEVLWRWLKDIWPRLERQERHFRIMPTHDMDSPFWTWQLSRYLKCRMLLADVIKRHDISLLMKHRQIWREVEAGKYEADPHNTFDKIMEISEKRGLTSTFFEMTTQGRNELDGNYDTQRPPVKQLVKTILKRGHKIGIHPGIGSYVNRKFIQADVEKLRALIAQENWTVENFGGRQHYLQWKAPDTWKYYEEIGLLYDTTLNYAEHIGFRCGICYDYPVYNAVTHEEYRLREYPLEVMDCGGLDKEYMNLPYETMRERCCSLKKCIKKYSGTFVILWHNDRFIEDTEAKLYEEILDG